MRLIQGLSEARLLHRIQRLNRNNGLGQRALGFYLSDFDQRRLYRKHGCSSTSQFALLKLQIPARKTRELLRVAKALEELPRLDRAFARGEVSWSAVRELTRVAVRDTEAEWIELAKTSGIRKVEWVVSRTERGERPPKDPYGLCATKLKVTAELSLEDHALWEAAFDRVAARVGLEVETAQVLVVLSRTFLERPIEEGEREMRKAFQVVYHQCTECDRAWMETAEGPAEVSPTKVERIERDAEVITLTGAGDPRGSGRLEDGPPRSGSTEAGDPRGLGELGDGSCGSGKTENGPGGSVSAGDDPRGSGARGNKPVPRAERDKPNTPQIRRQVLGRDGHFCAVPGCGNRGGLMAHHVIHRANGGRTIPVNEISVCPSCHGLIHEGLLHVEGAAPHGLKWSAADGTPLEASAEEVGRSGIAYSIERKGGFIERKGSFIEGTGCSVERTACSIETKGYDPRGSRSEGGEATIFDLDEVPDVIDGEWWRKHKHNFFFKGDRMYLKKAR